MKKQYIRENEGITDEYMNSVSYDRATDARTTAISPTPGENVVTMVNTSTSYTSGGRPRTSELNKYFFLPALGRVEYGAALETPLDIHGRYWSSTASPATATYGGVRMSYFLCFSSSSTYLDHGGYRYRGRPAVPDWFQ